MTAPILPTQLTFGRVRWLVFGLDIDTELDPDDQPDVVNVNGRAYVKADVNGSAILGQSLVTPATILTREIEMLIVNGRLTDKDGHTDVKLLANDSPGLSQTGWSYTIRYELDDDYTFGSFSFTLSTDQLVDLTMVVPLGEPSPGQIIVKGPKGDPGPGYGGGFLVGPANASNPLDLAIVSNWGITDGGSVYYDPNGALSSEAGLLVPDPETGGLTIWRPGAPFAVALDTRVSNLVNNASNTRTALDNRYLLKPSTGTDGQFLTRTSGQPAWTSLDTAGWASTKTLVAAATDAATANTLMKRDANGRADVADGIAATDIATKGQLDTAIATRVANSLLAAASGVATLDTAGKVPVSQLPALAINETFVVASQTAMLALTAERGDVAVRTDFTPNRVFILTTDAPATLANWREMTAAGSVITVDGMSGAVTLGAVPATNDTLARRGSTGTLIAATATLSTELTTLGQTQTLDTAAIASATTAGRQTPLSRTMSAAGSLAATDAGSILNISHTGSSPISVTVPTNASVPIPIGAVIDIRNTNTGMFSVVAASGVAILGLSSVASYMPTGSSVLLTKVNTDQWMILPLNTGQAMQVTPGSNFYHASGFQPLRVSRRDNHVTLDGALGNTAGYSASSVCANLLAQYRPTQGIVNGTVNYNGNVNVFGRVDIAANGDVTVLPPGSIGAGTIHFFNMSWDL